MSDAYYVPSADSPFMFFILHEYKISNEGGLIINGEFTVAIPLGNRPSDPSTGSDQGLVIHHLMQKPGEWVIPKALIPAGKSFDDINGKEAIAIITGIFADLPVAMIPPAPFELYNIPPHKRDKLKKINDLQIKRAFNDEIQ